MVPVAVCAVCAVAKVQFSPALNIAGFSGLGVSVWGCIATLHSYTSGCANRADRGIIVGRLKHVRKERLRWARISIPRASKFWAR